MNTRSFVCGIVAAGASTFAFAAPADDVKAAAAKLAAASNYSWTTTAQNAGGGGAGAMGGAVNGVTEAGGFSIVKRSTPSGELVTVAKGQKRVTQGPDGAWMTPEEMRAQMPQGGGGPGGRGAMPGMGPVVLPSDEIKNLLAKGVAEISASEGMIVATLTPEAVAPMFGRAPRGGAGGNPPPPPKDAMGTVTFWLRDGVIAKYAVHVMGTATAPNGKERKLDRTTTTEIKNLGTTKVEVPEAAKAKLGS